MSERLDLRRLAGDIREALAEADRETLIDVLTYVFEEYVIESPPPMRTPPADAPGETFGELAALSFAELVQTLQTHLDHPELALFRVQGEQVLVRAGGALAPLDAESPEPVAQADPAPDAAEELPPPPSGGRSGDAASLHPPPPSGGRAGVGGERGADTAAGRPPPPGGGRAGDAASLHPPPPSGGRAGDAASLHPPPPSGGRSGVGEEPPARSAPGTDPDEGGDDDASIRFSLLELD
jgi:hypothetical protein